MVSVTQVADEHLVDAYLTARNTVVRAGFAHELDWQNDRDVARISKCDFLRESAWVVLASGMSDLVVRRKFSAISAAFRWWQSSGSIMRYRNTCQNQAMRIFGHKGKINAILTIASVVLECGFQRIKERLAHDGVEFIRSLPYMGPATSLHLAKNIGLQTAKPDRHLCRLAQAAGYNSTEALCRRVSEFVADSVPVIDIVFWRYATLRRDYEHLFVVQKRSITASGRRN